MSIHQSRSGTIVLFANTCWSIFNFRLNLIRLLTQKGFRVVVIAPEDEYVSRVEEAGARFQPIAIQPYGTNPVRDLLMTFRLVRLLRKHEADLLITYTIKPNIYGSIAARLIRIPSLAVITGMGYLFTQRSWKTAVAKNLYRLSLRFCKAIWFLNEDDRRTFILEKLIRSDRAAYLPSEGVDTQHFAPSPNRKSSAFRFLFAGRLILEKGILDFIEVARILKKRYPKAQFDILGFLQPDYPNAISEQDIRAWEAEGIIRYLGSTDQIKNDLAKTDCVVLPTYYREGIPRILLEAGSMHIPVITTDNAGCRDVVDHTNNGYVCLPKNVESLTYWMDKMINLPEAERARMGVRSRKIIERLFDDELVNDQYLSFITGALAPTNVPSTALWFSNWPEAWLNQPAAQPSSTDKY
jgi:glycosyltransferase involved in cell wall biosynthesis